MALITFGEAMNNPEGFCVIDAKGNQYQGYYSRIRVDRRTLPEGWHAYDLRAADWDDPRWFSTIEDNYVMVNHGGTFLCKEELPLPVDLTGRRFAYIGDDDGDWDYTFIDI